MNDVPEMETGSRSRKSPAASVILPVYNAGRYLETAIESVLGQTFTDFELLLLNDGSTDGSPAVLERWVAKDPRCTLHSWPNRGLIATLNEGIRLARADILLRMDADDLCAPQRFEAQMAYLHRHPDCVAVGTRVRLIDPEGMPICTFAEDTGHVAIDAAHLAGRGGAIVHPATAMRKTAVAAVGGYRDEFPHAEDIDLFLRLAEVGQLANVPEILLDYRQHMGSIGYSQARVQNASAQRAVMAAHLRRGLEVAAGSGQVASEVPSLDDVHRKWGWWAMSGGNLDTARKHAFKAFRQRPWGLENWRLLACVLRGH